MAIPKNYFQDRLVLLLLSTNLFVTLLGSLLVLLRLGNRGGTHIVQFRSNLGLDAFTRGNSNPLLSFIAFSILVLVLHTVISMRVYHIRRHFSVAILGLGTLLLAVSVIVSNALLVYR